MRVCLACAFFRARQRFDRGAGKFRVVTQVVDFTADEPSDCASHDHVGREVPLSHHARCAHGGGQAIGKKLAERAWVFVRDHAGNRPSDRRMVGREGLAVAKERSLCVLEGCFSSECIVQGCGDAEAVQRGLSSENARFAVVIVMRVSTQKIQSTTGANHGVKDIVRHADVSAYIPWIARQSLDCRAITCEKASRCRSQREQPCAILPAEMSGACPNRSLIEKYISCER